MISSIFRRSRSALLAVLLVGVAIQHVSGDEVSLPRPTHSVTDAANVLTADETAELEIRLQSLRDSRLAVPIIYVVPSLPEGVVLEDLTLRAVNSWGIGDAATDNGLAIFVFLKDRKVRIEVGEGLESHISDAAAAAIINDQIAPSFRAGKYAEGLEAALDKIKTLLSEDSSRGVAAEAISPTKAEVAVAQPSIEHVTTRLGRTRRIIGAANAPHPKQVVNPHYPGKALAGRVEGAVEMTVLIDTSGKVIEVSVVKALPRGLTEAAVDAVKQWVFEPVVEDGASVPALIDVVVNFKLRT